MTNLEAIELQNRPRCMANTGHNIEEVISKNQMSKTVAPLFYNDEIIIFNTSYLGYL